MKKLFLLLLVMTGIFAHAQNVRYDAPFPSISSTTSTPYLVANVPPNSPTIAVCSSPANQVPCTNYITTYTSLGVACSNGAQDTPQPQPSACQSTGDAQGNIGFWAPAGIYDYTVSIGDNSFGPYTVTLGGAGPGTPGGSNTNLQYNNSGNFGGFADGTAHQVLHGGRTFSLVDLALDVLGITPIANGGTGTATPGLVAGTNVTLSGSWPNQTINATSVACPTCVVASSPGVGLAHFAGATQTVTSSTVATADIASNAVTGPKLATQYITWQGCEGKGFGDGLNAIPAATYLQFSCVNHTGVTVTLTGIRCYTDNAGTSTLNLANNAASSFLTGAVTCNNTKASGGAAATQSATTTLANGDGITFTFVSDGTSKQTNWTISATF